MSNPTIVLIHGGMHDDSCFAPLIAALNARSYPTVTGPLPTVSSPTPKSVDLSTDVDYVRSTLLAPLLDEGKDIVIAMHSYGGVVGASAVQGLCKTERVKEGKKGGVLGLVFIVALIVPVGSSPLDRMGGSWDPVPHIIEDKEAMTLTITTPTDTLFNGLSREQIVEYTKLWRRQSSRAFTSKIQYNAYDDPVYKARCAYLLCEDDMTAPYSVQQTFVETTGIKLTATLKANHMVILTMPEETAAEIVKFIGEFQKA